MTLAAGAHLTGGSLDVNGLKLILDPDGDTYFEAEADDIIAFFANATKRFSFEGSGIIGRTGITPSLGDPSSGKWWGNVFVADSKYVYDHGDELGVHQRFYGSQTFTWHFDRISSLPAGWSWAGTPFVTPSTVDFNYSLIRAQNTAAARAFLYRTYSTGLYQFVVGCMNPNTVGAYWGLRLDDGTDTNFAEFRQTITATGPTTWQFSVAATLGGVPQTPVVGTSYSIPVPLILSTQVSGTQWTSWTLWGKIMPCFGCFAYGIGWQCSIGSLNFTPTRHGVIYNFLGTSWHRVVVDAYHQQ